MRGTTPGWGRVPPILDNPGQYICLKQNNIWKNNWAYLHYIMFKGGRLKTRDIKPISILQINRDDFYLVQWSMTMTIGQWSCPDSFFSYTLWLRRYALFDFLISLTRIHSRSRNWWQNLHMIGTFWNIFWNSTNLGLYLLLITVFKIWKYIENWNKQELHRPRSYWIEWDWMRSFVLLKQVS